MEKDATFKSKLLGMIKHPVTKVIAGSGAVSAVGVGGYRMGYKGGAKRATNEMASAFSEANAKENQKIVSSFRAFNKMENRGIAQTYFKKGLAANPSMSKAAAYELAYDAALEAELEKLGYVGAIKAGLKTLGKSFRNLGAGSKNIVGTAKTGLGRDKVLNKKVMKNIGSQAKDTAKKSKAALTTIGVAGAGYAAS